MGKGVSSPEWGYIPSSGWGNQVVGGPRTDADADHAMLRATRENKLNLICSIQMHGSVGPPVITRVQHFSPATFSVCIRERQANSRRPDLIPTDLKFSSGFFRIVQF